MEGTDENVAHAWDKNRLYIICGNEKREFDCLSEEMNIERIELNDWRATNLCCTNDSLWASGYDDRIYEILSDNRVVEHRFLLECINKNNREASLWEKCERTDSPVFFESVCLGDSLFFIPLLTRSIVIIDKKNGNVETINEHSSLITERSEFGKWNRSGQFSLLGNYDNRYLVLYSFCKEQVILFDIFEKRFRDVEFELTPSVYQNVLNGETTVNETIDFSLYTLVDVVSEKISSFERNVRVQDGKCD